RRFEEARALGHALLDTMRQGAFGAASTTWAQESRRRRSGAFAAELLLPSSALGALSDGALDGIAEGERFADILKRYGIGARTAAYQLHNHGWLSDTSIRDDLIEEYGYREGGWAGPAAKRRGRWTRLGDRSAITSVCCRASGSAQNGAARLRGQPGCFGRSRCFQFWGFDFLSRRESLRDVASS